MPDASEMETTEKSEPFHTTKARIPLGIVTPVVGPAPTIFTPNPPVVALITTYVLLVDGALIVRSAVRAPVQLMIAYCAEVPLSAVPVALVSVTSASVDSVCVPATAASR